MDYAFISYSSEDRPFVLKLAEDLRSKGHEIWLDQWKITGRRPYWDEIQTGIEGCSHFIFVISPDSIAQGSGARKELYHAASLKPGPTMIPIMARATPYQSLPIIISPGEHQIHDFVSSPYDVMLERVEVALTKGGTKEIVLPYHKPDSPPSQATSRPAATPAQQVSVDDLFETRPAMRSPYQSVPVNRPVVAGAQQGNINPLALGVGFVAAVFGIFGISYLMTGRTTNGVVAFLGGLAWVFCVIVLLEVISGAGAYFDIYGYVQSGDITLPCLFIVPIHLIAAWIVSQKGATLPVAR
jgi:hypothetical protein